MSGHSKWSQIKRQKSVSDAARSRTFSRFARLIALESKKSNGVLSAPGLAAAVSRAKAANMPKDNIERAIKKGMSKDSGDLETVVYEAYGPGGVAIIITALTDNKNRTTQEIKHLLSLHGVELASLGAASWAFTKNADGYVPNEPGVEVAGADEELLSTILEALDEHDDVQRVFTNANGYADTGN
ncbi:TPA: YebC/PmpR family DNA-binding transcriptional regulator [Candidatus Kaiserbacteria bacterium]|nr:MAG: transcriptional regulator [Parcubacteria group bacterium GW2011_GWA1_56_13]KKW47001.1 MAG: transcriptional regulator [Parcubacteria group bacterium GW2011_GWB1_57_6]HCR52467.1 YebC/PmpR family DNA-binding transcriptional regulator [Candidatus Kaiserbacteria bacterium]